MRRILLVVAVAVAVPGSTEAQQVYGPAAGTWGAETGDGASLLRFRSPEAVWVVGGNFSYWRRETSGNAAVFSNTALTNASLRFGVRRYSAEGQALRTFRTFGPVLTYRSSTNDEFGGGVFFEFGAAHFFSRHLSLGASGAIYVQFLYGEGMLGSSGERFITRTWMIDASLVRLNAAVYF